ncbi:acetyltransferase [Phytopseudomonas dryadis]|uniref:Acetyltransferase n=1 Tax=Phytopseudomonas dryadis TaxID=2487520 RepID=A0A4Q9QVG1_9GAMM|nr:MULTISPECIES: acetyltransferase [Pseudomonas]TBU86606.1 acetyltransferase [Pseudomonas dryadis]TBV07005.1 acetyltransferase [Pseudomonas dryadis]TBV19602.1 acetyltransferase [Pseudomonas sp. FRB 230]
MPIRPRQAADNPRLLDIWHRAVLATHAFLSAADVEALYQQVRDVYLQAVEVDVYTLADGRVAGFIGMSERHVEMLFVDPEQHGQGIGSRLLDDARARLGRLTVDVNEQNPAAHGFYRRYGFRDTGRSATDGEGRPFPLIHMAL